MAQGLVAQRTHTLGVLVRDAVRPFYGHLHAALQGRAIEGGYRVVTATGVRDFALDEERRALQRLLSLRVEGLVVCSGLLPARDIAPFVERVPTVVAGRPEPHPAINSVYCDEEDGAEQLVDHLVSLGHRRQRTGRWPGSPRRRGARADRGPRDHSDHVPPGRRHGQCPGTTPSSRSAGARRHVGQTISLFRFHSGDWNAQWWRDMTWVHVRSWRLQGAEAAV
ncbi:substrate-binding domain-containing protein [Streptomyces sp. MK37H]|uniref:substrate-binding domain-containing protein n=1 Tax=Streptomyces sp. MK37H TaxID=2699117 RepID=UPI001B384854|nr:substrate-binding domain-containing protein [Streptomyces sp. MK37H]MBP8536579.1 hypothetical protein [Streptomyces sp. MK37H]